MAPTCPEASRVVVPPTKLAKQEIWVISRTAILHT